VQSLWLRTVSGVEPLRPAHYLVGEQAEDGQGELRAYVHLAIRHGGHGPFHGGSGGAGTADWTAIQQCSDVGCVISIQDCRRIALPSGVVDDPNDASCSAIRRNGGHATARREGVAGASRLRRGNSAIGNLELGQREVLAGIVDVAIPVCG
jgi:hypothetical protein